MTTLTDKLAEAFDILDRAHAKHKPVAVVGLYSGGNDSLAVMGVLELWGAARGIPFHVAHINTGIGIEETRLHVRGTAAARGWNFLELTTPPETFVQMVTGGMEPVVPGGFPGPAMHHIYYSRLKDRRVDELMRLMKQGHKRSAQVMLVSGIRQQESKRRMGYANEVNKHRAQVWVNPCLRWSADDCADMREVYRLPQSPVSACLHRSGECLCGAMADRGELEETRFWFPKAGTMLDEIARLVDAAGYPWAWDEAPPDWFLQQQRGQMDLFDFMPLCVGCQSRKEAA